MLGLSLWIHTLGHFTIALMEENGVKGCSNSPWFKDDVAFWQDADNEFVLNGFERACGRVI
jgi:hypothetical protein